MATYCIGDLHGRYDLFEMMLDKIEFNHKTDKLYILGDVIDEGKEGIRILKYVMQHPNSCFMLMGNHEDFFLRMCTKYDVFMLSEKKRKLFKNVLDVYSEKLFSNIKNFFDKNVVASNTEDMLNDVKIQNWLKEGVYIKRKGILDAMIELAEGCTLEEYKIARSILDSMEGHFKIKNMLKELFEEEPEVYLLIKDFLKKLPRDISLQVGKNQYKLYHAASLFLCPNKSRKMSLIHADAYEVNFLFGHIPVPRLHSELCYLQRTYWNFNYREVFSYVDDKNNFYYNLDLNSNPIAAMCLENKRVYYVGKEGKRKDSKWTVPSDMLKINDVEYELVCDAQFLHEEFKMKVPGKNTFAFISKIQGANEFLVGVDKKKRLIFYTRVDWLDYHLSFVIKDWYDGQNMDEIIAKVREDARIQIQEEKGAGLRELVLISV